jgi:hypothetical protein
MRQSYNTGPFLQCGSEAWTSAGSSAGLLFGYRMCDTEKCPLCAWNDYMVTAVSGSENEVYRVQQEVKCIIFLVQHSELGYVFNVI